MIAAVVAVCVVILAIIGTIAGLSSALSSARVLAAQRLDRIAALMVDNKNLNTRADYQERRADALDAELDVVADSGNPADARGRVLARLKAGEASGDRPAGAVSTGGQDPKVASHDDTALERPDA